jgi:hypothetical protein
VAYAWINAGTALSQVHHSSRRQGYEEEEEFTSFQPHQADYDVLHLGAYFESRIWSVISALPIL